MQPLTPATLPPEELQLVAMFLGRLRGKAPQQADAEFLRDITALRNSSTIDPNTIGALGLYLFTAPTLIAAHVEGIEVHLVGDIAGST